MRWGEFEPREGPSRGDREGQSQPPLLQWLDQRLAPLGRQELRVVEFLGRDVVVNHHDSANHQWARERSTSHLVDADHDLAPGQELPFIGEQVHVARVHLPRVPRPATPSIPIHEQHRDPGAS